MKSLKIINYKKEYILNYFIGLVFHSFLQYLIIIINKLDKKLNTDFSCCY